MKLSQFALTFPGMQLAHSVEPLDSPCPTGQSSLQTATEEEPVTVGLIFPDGQKTQFSAASVSIYFPTPQSRQADSRVEDVLLLCLPGGQAVHFARAAAPTL